MSRLPTPGGDDNTWGNVLNDFLAVEHNTDGTLKTSGSLNAKEDKANKGIAGGYAPLDGSGKVPSGNLPAGSTPDATTSSKGVVQLAGDLAGTAALPTVPGLSTKANDSGVVHNTGNETIAGVKTFSSNPIVSTPSASTEVANKSYVDGVAGSGSTPDADAVTKGKVQLAGDLSGTAAAPTIAAGAITSAKIADGTIVNADVNAAAAIAVTKLAAGSNGQVLTTTSGAPAWGASAGGPPSGSAGGDLTGTYPNPTLAVDRIPKSIVTTKGDVIAATASATPSRLGVGTDGQVLTASAAAGTGLTWSTPATGGSAHIIEDEGTPLTARNNLNFTGAGVTAADSGGKTVVTIPGGSTFINVPGFRSVTAFGAVNDGGTDCTAAVTACQNALVADGISTLTGGIMFFPPGRYMMNTSAFSTKDGVTWQGAGKFASNIYFPTDAGPGTYALVPAPLATYAHPVFRDLSIKGPGNTNPGIGVKPCEMSGLKTAYWTEIDNCWITGFNRGVEVTGDHNVFRRVVVDGCYDAWYYGAGWLTKGDQSYYDCVFGGTRSGILVTDDNTLDSVMFLNCHWVGSPFGILRPPTSTAGGAMLRTCTFDSSGFEQIGNSAIADLAPVASDSWVDNRIDGTGWSQQDAYRLSGYGTTDYAINLPNACTAGYIRNDTLYPFSNSGAHGGGAYLFNYASDIEVIGGSYLDFTNPGNYWTNNLGFHYVRMLASGTISANDVVEEVPGSTYETCKRATGVSPTKPVIGIAQNAASNNGGVLVALFNLTPWGSVLTETVSAGDAMAQKTGTYHRMGLASAYPANPVLGWARAGGGNSGATATAQMRFKVGG